MGGRGRRARSGPRQRTINEEIKRREILNIVEENNEKRASGKSSGIGVGGYSSPQILKKCACCGEYTIPIGSEYEICSNCGWIDDPYQNKNPNSVKGRNPISLIEARENYARLKDIRQ